MRVSVPILLFMIRPTINEVRDKVLEIVNRPHILPVTANKGKPGNYLELLTGIPTSSACLDCSDGEVKVFPITRRKNGTFGPKETIAVTMINATDLTRDTFGESRLHKKLTRVLYVPYERDGDMITYKSPTIVEMNEVDAILRKDYDDIRERLQASGTLSGQRGMGVYLQTRTKGPKASTTRAFYLKKKFMEDMVNM